MARRYESIATIKAANKAAGRFFFEPDTMRFFNSRILEGVYGGRYFVTSERQPDSRDGTRHPRTYTVREAGDNGDIRTVGRFQDYSTARGARNAAMELASCRLRAEAGGYSVTEEYQDREKVYLVWRNRGGLDVSSGVVARAMNEVDAWAVAAGKASGK